MSNWGGFCGRDCEGFVEGAVFLRSGELELKGFVFSDEDFEGWFSDSVEDVLGSLESGRGGGLFGGEKLSNCVEGEGGEFADFVVDDFGGLDFGVA